MLGTATSKMPPSKATQLQNQETVLVLFLALPLCVCGILGIQECGTNLTQDATLEVRYLTRNSRALLAKLGEENILRVGECESSPRFLVRFVPRSRANPGLEDSPKIRQRFSLKMVLIIYV